MIVPEYTPYNKLVSINNEFRIKVAHLRILIMQLNTAQDPILVKNIQQKIDQVEHELRPLDYSIRMECLTDDQLKELLRPLNISVYIKK